MVKPLGPNQRFRCSASVNRRQTRSRGASTTRVMTKGCMPPASAGRVSVPAIARLSCRLPQLAEVVLEPVEPLLPKGAVAVEPARRLLERLGGAAAQARPSLPAPRDEAGALQHLQVLGDGRQAYREGPGQLRHRGLARGEPRQDGAPRRVRQGGEGGAERVGPHLLVNRSVI